MSRPRKPFGAKQPGRLPSTMMKVLAAEMSDPQRLRRGKQYAHDGSVTDIVVEEGVVTCEVLGSRSTPYVASLHVDPGDGMPLKRDVRGECTCPDADDMWGTAAGGSDICKHVVAAMFAFSDELLIEPELLDVWRRREPGAAADSDGRDQPDTRDADARHEARPDTATGRSRRAAGDAGGRSPDSRRRRHLRVVGPHERARSGDADEAEPAEQLPHVDRLAELLAVPAGRALPEIPALEPVDTARPRRPEVAAPLRDALMHLHLDWD